MSEPSRLFALAEASARFAAVLGAGSLLLLSFAITINILMRWLFAAPIHAVEDVSYLIIATAIAAAAPLCFLRKGNISVDVLGRSLRLIWRATYRLLDTFSSLATLIVVGLMTWQLALFAAENTSAGATTAVAGWITGPWWWVVAAFFALATATQAVVLIRGTTVSLNDGLEQEDE